MNEDLKYLVLGYRKYTQTTQRELAIKLGVPLEIETALEMDYKRPTQKLMNKIIELTREYNQEELKNIGRGFRIKDELGPDFKYYLRGLNKEKNINPKELISLPTQDCLRTIGSVDMDEFELVYIGRNYQ